MDIIRLCAWGYAALLGFVILTGYVPAFIDRNDMIFGLFRRTWYADGLHLVSALWAAIAAMTSRRASELFFQLFGVFYFADGVLGLLTGSGYLDFGILINGVLNLPLTTRIFANAPHLGLGGVAILIGYVLAPRTGLLSMLRWLRRLLAAVAILIALTIVVPLAYIEGTCRPPSTTLASPTEARALLTIDQQGFRRKQDNTYFTFPEWYIVYSFEDFGRFLDRSSESQFNYLGHIRGFWQSFCTINRAVPESGESRFEVKTMIYVIGVSYSTEYAIKGLYENTVGRLFEWIRGPEKTPQDEYARQVLQDYAAFLYTVPWFKFPFREKLDGLEAISQPSPSPVRTWERDFALGTEYFLKIGYAWLIQKALDASNDDEPRDIMFVVATLPQELLAKEPRIKPIRTLTPQWQLVQAPRYKDLTEILQNLLDRNIALAEIAGNREILITVIAPDSSKLDVKDTTELFSLPLDSRPGFRRAGLKARIDRLVGINRDLKERGATIEHFYDY